MNSNLSIQQAAKILGVSAKTLRRWEANGSLIPQRTAGGQRRYPLEQVKSFKKPKRIALNEGSYREEIAESFIQETLHSPIFPVQKYVLAVVLGVLVLASFAVVVVKSDVIDKVSPRIKQITQRGTAVSTQIAQVLAAESVNPQYQMKVSIPSIFLKDITAPNVIYSIKAGTGIQISGNQNLTISSTAPTTNTDPGSAQKIFKTFKIGDTSITASSNTDTFTIAAGDNVNLSADADNKKLTISADSFDAASTGWTVDGSVMRLTTATDLVSIGTATGSAKLSVTGLGPEDVFTASQSGNLIAKLDANGLFNLSATGFSSGLKLQNASTLFSGAGAPSNLNGNNGDYYFRTDGSGNTSTYVKVLGSWTTAGGASTSLQDAYDSGSTITTSNNNNLAITLANTAIDSNLLVNIASGSTGSFQLQNAGTTVTTLDTSGITTNGNTVLGDTTSDTITATARIASSLIPNADITYDLGSASNRWNTIYANNILSGGSGVSGDWQRNAGAIAPANITDDVLLGATATSSAVIVLSGTTGNITTTGTLQTVGFKLTTGAASGFALISDGVGNGSWTDLSTSGTAGPWTLSGSSLFPDLATYKLLVGSVTAADAIGNFNVSGNIAGKALAILNYTGSDQSILTASSSGITKYILDASGNASQSGNLTMNSAGFLQTTNNQLLTLGGSSTGNIALSPQGGAGKVNVNGTLELTALRLTTSPGVGYFMTSDGSGNGSWTNTSGPGTFGNWTLTGNTLYPSVLTYDVLIGSTDTTTDIGRFNVQGDKAGKALAVINSTSTDQNILVASVSGATKFIVDHSGNITTAGDVITTATSANLFNTNATTVNLAGATTTLNIGNGTTGNTIGIGNGINTVAQTINLGNGASAADSTVNILSGAGTAGAGILALGNNTRVTTIGLGNVAPAAARTITIAGGNSAQNDTVNILAGNPSANTQTFNLFSGSPSGGAQNVNLGTGISTGTITIGKTGTNGTNGSNLQLPGGILVSGAVTGKALAIIDEEGNQNILTASATGATKMTLDRNGVLYLVGGQTADITTLSSAAGTALTIAPSAPTSTGNGVVLALKGSAATTTGNGGAVNLTGGAAAGAAGTGGAVNLTSGAGGASGTAPSGAIALLTGNASSGTAGNITLDVGTSSTSNGSILIGTTARNQTITLGNTTSTAAVTINSGVVSGTTTTSALALNFNALTTGTGQYITSSTLTTGNLFSDYSTSTALSTGKLGYFNWEPSAVATASGDLVGINIGNGGYTTGNLFNITNAGSSLFSVNQNQIVSSIPQAFNAAGDVSLAYDLNFTNPTSSYIKSQAPLYLQTGPSYSSNNLTFTTYNSGRILGDMTQLGGLTLSSNIAGVTSQSLFQVNGASTGKALVSLNEVGDQDVLAASASGTTLLRLARNGDLTLTSSDTATASAFIVNTSTSAGVKGLAIKLSSTTLDTTSRFINFLDKSGIVIGKVNAANTTTVAYSANGTDMAEYFVKNGEAFGPGDVVSVSNNDITKTSLGYDSKMVGVVSTAPSFVGGIEGDNKVLVAIAGQVPVKIDQFSDPISKGDFITGSPDSGRATKATHAGFMIGKALESWTPGSSDTINIYLSNTWADPNQQLAFDGSGNLSINGKLTASDVDLTSLTNSVNDSISTINNKFNLVDSQIASLSAEIADLKLQANPGATISADINWQLATDSGKLVSVYDIQAPSLTLTGKLKVGLLAFDDIDASIESLTGVITAKGDLIVENSVSAQKYNVDTSSVLGASLGKATIPAGQKDLVINTTAVSTTSAIFVTPEIYAIPVASEATRAGEFVIRLPFTIADDLKVNWWVIN